MESLPIFLRLQNRKCLVIGDAANTAPAVRSLRRIGALVTVIERDQTVPLETAAATQTAFKESDLDGCWLVVCAFKDESQNQAIATACEKRQLLCHVVGNPRHSSLDINELDPVSSQPAPDFGSALTAEPLAPSGNIRVSLVGAGPGDPDLLTIKALRLIQSADAVVYDRLVSQSILALCNPNAEFVYAGKAKADHALPQDSINQLLVDLAQSHQRVVRLKGGDPFIFGRGGEEIETLSEQGISFQVVPGITAASGCAAFSGIPLTHRDHAQSCVFITGHLKDGKINLNWKDLRDPNQTIVVYMGLTGLRGICDTLVAQGRAPDTPAALVEQGTTADQRVLASTLCDLPDLVDQNNVGAPTLLIIGGVVTLRQKLQWFNK
ncbi:uroporphyrinogen-III C-methyltransferase [Chromatiales bacterium (ex Bugula neritina AB1)]|nr:uroporphyrinogen-III C-methyltransferase [Chromatiales bacterium (ex Bugula neritina AB1)]